MAYRRQSPMSHGMPYGRWDTSLHGEVLALSQTRLVKGQRENRAFSGPWSRQIWLAPSGSYNNGWRNRWRWGGRVGRLEQITVEDRWGTVLCVQCICVWNYLLLSDYVVRSAESVTLLHNESKNVKSQRNPPNKNKDLTVKVYSRALLQTILSLSNIEH